MSRVDHTPQARLRDPGIAAVLLGGVVALAVMASGAGSPTFKLLFIWGFQVPFDLAAALFCYRAYRVPGSAAPVRRFLGGLAVMCSVFALGDGFQFVRLLIRPDLAELNGGVVQTACYLGGLLLIVVLMVLHPTPGGTRGERFRFYLDAVTVLVSGAVLAWCLGVEPSGRADWANTLLVVCPTLAAAFGAVKMLLSDNAPLTRAAAVPLVLAAILIGVSFVAPATGADGLHPALLGARVLATVLFALGPRIQELRMRRDPALRRTRARWSYHLLPYAAIVTTFGLFLAVMPVGAGLRVWGAVAGVVTITGVVLLRQVLAFRDNVELIDRLDATLLDLRGHEERLREQATTDDLTRLANRAAFGDALDADLAAGTPGLAVLLIDLDDFKTVNDTLGHGVGDGLLALTADRLRDAVRESDLVARLGGDEFAVLLRAVTPDDAGALADRILEAVTQPGPVGDHVLVARASIGLAPARAGDDAEGLMRNADIAMYAAKDAGKGGFRVYEDDMGARILRTAQLGDRLRSAIDAGEFVLVYQPVVDLDTAAVIGAEALVRWQPPDGPPIPPADFIPTAEHTGDIVPLGRWILGEACRQLAEWRRDLPGAESLHMAVNVAGRQLQTPGFVDEVARALATHGVPADRLVIEVTETAVLDDPTVLAALHGLRGLGLELALDDFGTAASSLGLLLTCPMTGLKLDRSFVDGLGQDSRPTAVATAVIQIAHALHLGTVAEGVETPEQAKRLRELGYRQAQGYLYAPPLPPAEFATRLSPSRTG